MDLMISAHFKDIFICQMNINMNFPDLPDACFSESMTNKTMLGIIDQLKENPATEYPNIFKNRWDEIVSITSANVAQNEYKWANGRYRGSV